MNDEQSPVLEELVPGSRSLYLMFGGLYGDMGIPPFEFYKSSRIIHENKIFLRDLKQSWYQCGIPGIANDVFELADFLDTKIRRIGPHETFFIGNSMGGYAAILFASLLNTGKVIAFTPQTFIFPIKRLWYMDVRWIRRILKTYRATIFGRHIYDLKTLVDHNKNPIIKIFFSTEDRLDGVHAENLESFDNVTVWRYTIGGHGLVKILRDTGDLIAILNDKPGGHGITPDGSSGVLHRRR